MRSSGKTVRLVGMLTLAAAIALPLCAHATEAGAGNYEMPIVADVVKDGDEVISVVVPSSVSIVVETSVIDGRIMGMTAGRATISNSPNSQAPIKVEVNSVADALVAGNKLLSFVDMTFDGQHQVAVSEGDNKRDVLFDAIAPGQTGALGVELTQKDETVLVPAGSYSIKATLRVAQVT